MSILKLNEKEIVLLLYISYLYIPKLLEEKNHFLVNIGRVFFYN